MSIKKNGDVIRIRQNNDEIIKVMQNGIILFSSATLTTPTRNLTNCAATLLSAATTGTATQAVIGSTWSIKITPTSGYYFVEGETTPAITFDGVDVSSDTSKVTIVYNSADNSYTLTILDVPDCAIGITAAARLYDAVVEYLQGDGTAYIDTDIVLTSAHIIDVDFTYIGNQRLIGARKDNSSYASIGIYSKYIDLNATSATVTTGRLTMTLSDGERYKAHAENGKRQYFAANGTLLGQNTHSAASFNTNRKAAIFALRWAADTVAPAVGRIHSLVITYDGSKVLDFIPVRKNGVGYLYDKVSGQLFGNANSSGAFTYGNDVSAVQSNSLLSGSLVSPSDTPDTPDEPNDLDPIDMEDM